MTMLIPGILLKVTLVASGMLLVSFALRGMRAAIRHLVLAAGFAILLMLPVAAVVLPTLDIEIKRPLPGLQRAFVGPNLTVAKQSPSIGATTLAGALLRASGLLPLLVPPTHLDLLPAAKSRGGASV